MSKITLPSTYVWHSRTVSDSEWVLGMDRELRSLIHQIAAHETIVPIQPGARAGVAEIVLDGVLVPARGGNEMP